MSRILGSVAVVLSLVLAVPASASTAPTSPDSAALHGSWRGGYRIAGHDTSAFLRLRVTRGHAAGVLYRVGPEADSMVLSVALGRDAVSLEAARGGLRLRGVLSADRLRGTVRAGGAQGTFEFVHVRPVPMDSLARYVGDYGLGPDSTLVIGRSFRQPWLMRPDGTQAPLYAIDEHSLFAGPNHGSTFPICTLLDFERDATGAPTAVRWTERGAPPRRLQRQRRYDVRQVKFTNGAVHLAGEVLVPKRPGPRPGVVLLHGSNAQSRNGQDSFLRFIADDLARAGILVLIYDKRGIGGSEGDPNDAGLDGDALEALRMLARQPEADTRRLGFYGISQGVGLAVLAAARAPAEVAFVVLNSGSPKDGHVQEIERTELMMRADGFREDQIRRALELQRLKFQYARRPTDEHWAEYIAYAERSRHERWFDDPYVGPPLDRTSGAWEFWGRRMAVPDSLSEQAAYRKVRCPVLGLFGDLDVHNRVATGMTLFDEEFQLGGNQHVTMRLFGGATHGMYAGRTGGPSEMASYDRWVPEFLPTLRSWILAQAGKPEPR